jgi:hypothetical protein
VYACGFQRFKILFKSETLAGSDTHRIRKDKENVQKAVG